jgi:O-antigen/teichoic acid export membrane protein
MRVFKNAFWLTTGRTVADVASFALFMAVSRILGPSGTGEYSYAFAIGNLIAIIASSGFDEYGIREFACASPAERPALWRNLTAAQPPRLALGVICLVLFLLSGFNHVARPAVIIEFAVFFTGWYIARLLFVPAMAQQSMAAPALSDLSCRLFAIALAVCLIVLARRSLPLAVIGFPIAGVALSCLGLLNARRRAGRPELKAPRAGVVAVLRGTAPFAASDLLYQFYSRTDLLLIAYWLGTAQTGFYATAVKFVEVGLLPLVLLGTAAYPVIGRLAVSRSPMFDRAAREFTFVIFALSGWVAVGVAWVLPPLIVPLFGKRFEPATPLLAWFAILALTKGVDAAFSRLLYCVREQSWYVRMLALGTACVVVLNCALIPVLGLRGAAIAAIASSFVGNLGCTYGLRRYMRPRVVLSATTRLIVALAGTGGALVAAEALGVGPWARALLAFLLFPLAALAAGLIPDWRHSPVFGSARSDAGGLASRASPTSGGPAH